MMMPELCRVDGCWSIIAVDYWFDAHCCEQHLQAVTEHGGYAGCEFDGEHCACYRCKRRREPFTAGDPAAHMWLPT